MPRSTGIKEWHRFGTATGEGEEAELMQGITVGVRSHPLGWSTEASSELPPHGTGHIQGTVYQGNVFHDRSRARLAAEALGNRIAAGRKHHDQGQEYEYTEERD